MESEPRSSNSSGLFFGTCRKNMATSIITHVTANSIMGMGSSTWEIKGEIELNERPMELQRPIAVAANSVGKM